MKATFLVEDNSDGTLSFQAEFDPPATEDLPDTPASVIAGNMLESARVTMESMRGRPVDQAEEARDGRL